MGKGDRIFVLLNRTIKFLLVDSFLIVAVLFGGYIITDLFITKKQESLAFTYYAFAIFAVLSNISFSYSRTFDESKSVQFYLRGLGERFLFCAFGFLIGSLLNFINVHSKELFNRHPLPIFVLTIVDIIAGLLFMASFFFAVQATHSLLEHLFEKIMLNKDNYKGK